MNERTVSVGAYQLGMLDVLKDIANLPLILEHLPPVDVEGIVYGCMIQCGAERFEVARIENRSLPNSKYLRSRLSYIPEEKTFKARNIISRAFQSFLPREYRRDAKCYEVWDIENFLADLLLCAERKTALMTLSALPDPDQFEGILPSELLVPVRNLLSTLEPSNIGSPLPRSSISAVGIRRFEEIISSDLFSAYSKQHSELESSLVPKSAALKSIAETGDKLFRRHINLLQLKKLTLIILPVTAKIVDTIFGKLPGVLAGYFTSLLTDALKDERRIVVYQLDSVFRDLITSRVLHFVEEQNRE